MSQVEQTPPPHQTDEAPTEELTTRRPQFQGSSSRHGQDGRKRRSRSPQRRSRMREGYPSSQQPFGQYSQQQPQYSQPGVYMSPMMLSPQQQSFLMQQQHMLQQQQGTATGRTQQQMQQQQPQLQPIDPMQQYNAYGMNQMMQPNMMPPNYVPPGFLPPLIPNVSRPLPDIVDLRSLRSAIAIIREDSEAQAVLARDAARNAQQLAEQGQKLQQVYLRLLKDDRLKASNAVERRQKARAQREKRDDTSHVSEEAQNDE